MEKSRFRLFSGFRKMALGLFRAGKSRAWVGLGLGRYLVYVWNYCQRIPPLGHVEIPKYRKSEIKYLVRISNHKVLSYYGKKVLDIFLWILGKYCPRIKRIKITHFPFSGHWHSWLHFGRWQSRCYQAHVWQNEIPWKEEVNKARSSTFCKLCYSFGGQQISILFDYFHKPILLRRTRLADMIYSIFNSYLL